MNAIPPVVSEEAVMSSSQRKIAAAVGEILTQIGEDVHRQGLLKTPERVAKAYEFLTKGYDEDAGAVIRGAMFDESYSEMVLVKDIEMYSLCEHHMLPFFRQSSYRLYTQRQDSGTEQIASRGRYLLPTFASPRAPHDRDQGLYSRNSSTYRGGRGH